MSPDDGWNGALTQLMERMDSAIERLDEMAERKRDVGGSDFDRLRGKSQGVRLARSFAAEIFRGSHTGVDL